MSQQGYVYLAYGFTLGTFSLFVISLYLKSRRIRKRLGHKT